MMTRSQFITASEEDVAAKLLEYEATIRECNAAKKKADELEKNLKSLEATRDEARKDFEIGLQERKKQWREDKKKAIKQINVMETKSTEGEEADNAEQDPDAQGGETQATEWDLSGAQIANILSAYRVRI